MNYYERVQSAVDYIEKHLESDIVLQKIANPATITSVTEREKYEKLKEKLIEESGKGNLTANVVLSAAKKSYAQPANMKVAFQQMANPAIAVSEQDKKRFSDLHGKLSEASKQGNQLAASLLNIKESTSEAEIQKLNEKLREAKQSGEPLASSVLSTLGEPVSLPTANTVQAVDAQEYEEVKKMWKENYQNLDIPEGMAGTRAEWIKDDISKINTIVGMLTSTDAEQINAGMQEVSTILPFLLVGGFSQSEIVTYLQTKQSAAKEVLESLSQDEENKVSIEKKIVITEHSMAASVDDSHDVLTTPTTIQTTNFVTPQISNEILALVNLKMPRMRDIARYETISLSKDATKLAEVQNVHEVLERIANPAKISVITDRDHYEKLKEKLVEESNKGNMTAAMVLSAATKTPGKTSITEVKTTLTQIANPAAVSSVTDKKRFTELNEKLNQASKQGNELATSVLAVKEDTSPEEINNLSEKLRDAKQKGEAIATSVLSKIDESAALPEANAVQTVDNEEYEEVKKMGEENYRKLPVPAGFHADTAGRIEWITSDGVQVQETIGLLLSAEPEKKAEGLKKVSAVLPFLLLGGFSQQEMIQYLRTKLDAGKIVMGELRQDQGTQEQVAGATQPKEETKTMAAEAPTEEKKSDSANVLSEKKENG